MADPGFVSLDRMDGVNRFGAQVGFDKIDRLSLGDFLATRLELYGQMKMESQPIGFYAMMPFAHAFVDGDDTSSWGNLEAGAYYLYQPGGDLQIVARGGVSFATANDETDSFERVLLNGFTAFERLTDMVAIAPNTNWIRASVSPIWHKGTVFARGDLGADIPIAGDNGAQDVLLHMNAGVGAEAGPVAVMGELVTVSDPSQDGDFTDKFVHTFTASIATTGKNQVRAAFVLPLDDAIRGELWIVSVGYQQQL